MGFGYLPGGPGAARRSAAGLAGRPAFMLGEELGVPQRKVEEHGVAGRIETAGVSAVPRRITQQFLCPIMSRRRRWRGHRPLRRGRWPRGGRGSPGAFGPAGRRRTAVVRCPPPRKWSTANLLSGPAMRVACLRHSRHTPPRGPGRPAAGHAGSDRDTAGTPGQPRQSRPRRTPPPVTLLAAAGRPPVVTRPPTTSRAHTGGFTRPRVASPDRTHTGSPPAALAAAGSPPPGRPTARALVPGRADRWVCQPRVEQIVAGRPGRGGGASPALRTAARLSPHLLRHFAASDLYRDRMNVVAIQEVLGHQWAEHHDDLRACRQDPHRTGMGPPVAGPLTGSEAVTCRSSNRIVTGRPDHRWRHLPRADHQAGVGEHRVQVATPSRHHAAAAAIRRFHFIVIGIGGHEPCCWNRRSAVPTGNTGGQRARPATPIEQLSRPHEAPARSATWHERPRGESGPALPRTRSSVSSLFRCARPSWLRWRPSRCRYARLVTGCPRSGGAWSGFFVLVARAWASR